MSSVALSKGNSSAVQLRLHFDMCSSGPSSGSVLLDVAKVAGNFMGTSGTFGSFINEACSHTMPETTSSLASTRVEASELMVGGNTCNGTILESYANVDKAQCKKICIGRIQGYNGAFNAEQCGGYAFNLK